jgi:hypothetical protein
MVSIPINATIDNHAKPSQSAAALDLMRNKFVSLPRLF